MLCRSLFVFLSFFCWPLYCVSFFHLRLLITPLVSVGHCIACPSLISGFWLPLWYLLAIVLHVRLWYPASDYPFGIFWPLYCMSVFDIRLLITPLLSVDHCIVYPSSIYGFWLPLWYLLTIVLCPSLISGFWLPLWYLLAIVLDVRLPYPASDYPFGICWPLYWMSVFHIRLLITPLVSVGHCIVMSVFYIRLLITPLVSVGHCIVMSVFDIRLLITPLVSVGHCIVMSVFDIRLLITPLVSVDHCIVMSVFDIRLLITPLVSVGHCIVMSVFDIRLLITPLVSVGHCIGCPSSISGFWLPLWYLLTIVLVSFFHLRLLITPLVSIDHCIVYPSSIYGFWLPLWYLLTIVLDVRLLYPASDYPFGIYWPLYWMSVFDIRLLITPLVSVGHCIGYPSLIYGFWLPLWYLLTIVLDIRLWYGFWLPLWYLLAIVLDIRLWYPASDYPFGICWPLYWMSVFHIRLLITPLVSVGHCIGILLPFTLLITPLVSVDHCIVYPSSIYGFWLPLWYLLAIVLDVRLPYTASDYPFGICWPLYWMSVFDIRLLITPLVSVGHCIGCPSSIYGFWLPLWYLLAIVLDIRLWYPASDYPFGICWPLYWMSVFDIRLLITPLVSVGHCIGCPSLIYGFWLPLWYLLAIVLWCPSSIYGFWLPLWYLLTIVLDVRLWYPASDYPFGICWPLYWMSVFHIRLLITPLVSVGHCIGCPSSIYGFWLPLWYLLTIVLDVRLWYPASDYPFGICWPLYCDVRLWYPASDYPFGICWPLYCDVRLWYTASDYPFGIYWPLYCDVRLWYPASDYPFGICWPLYCMYPSLIYGFWLPLWYLLTIVLHVRLWYPASDYPFGICWPLYCVSFFHLRLLITPLVSVDHCIVYPSSIYGFWLPLWYLLTIVLCILLPFTLLITPLVSVDHCIVYPSSIYGFWLPLWYLLTIVLCILLPFTASDYPFGICWPLYCVSFFHLRLLITPLVSVDHCIVYPSSIYGFWLPLWYLLTIVLCILLLITPLVSVDHCIVYPSSDYPFGICWPLYCVSFFHLRLLITPLVSVDHCIVYPSSIYGFWLPLWYLLTIVLCILFPFTASDYPFGICWPLYCGSFFHLRLLITSLVSVDHCIVYPSSIYGFWLPLWYLLTIVLCILLPFTASDYPFGICWPLYCVSFFHLRLLITPLVSVDHCIVYPSSIYASDYSFGICWPLYCVSFFHLRLLITPLVSVDHCIVYSSSIYGFWLPLWYLLTIVLCILLPFTASDYTFGICWPLYCVSYFHLRLLITPLVSVDHCIVYPSSIYASDYPFGICWPLYCVSFFHLRLLITPLVSVDHCIVYPSSIYGFWLPLWYLLTIVLCILLPFTASDYPFGICWPLYCVSFFHLRLLITHLVSVDHCIVYPSSIYGFWLPLWYLLTIVLCILLPFTASDYPFGICWPLYCVSFFHLRLLITPLVSVDHCIVYPSSIYGFWLPFWYLLTIVLCILLPFTASDYPFGICWPLYCVSFFHLRLLITPLVSVDHCIVYPSSIYGFWLPIWYLLTIVLCILLPFTASHYSFGICWPLYCVSFFHLRLLITHLVSVDHCIVYPSIYGFWLPLWYLLTIVLCILLLITPLVSVDHCIVYPSSDYPFGICWPLHCVSFFHLRLLITPLVSVDHCIVYPSSIYGFWLPLWYLLTIVLCILLPFTASDYPFGICWPLYCVSFFHLRLLITPLVFVDHCIVYPSSIYGFWLPLWYLLTIVLCILLPFTASDYPFGICWPLYCVSFFHLRLLITPLVFVDHCIVYPSSIYGFWLPLWYLLTIVLCILLPFTASDYPFGICWPLYCVSFFQLRLLITHLVSSTFLASKYGKVIFNNNNKPIVSFKRWNKNL